MRTIMTALLAGVFLTCPAHATDLTGIDFLVDGKTYAGREVTVRDCTIVGATSSAVACNVQSQGRTVGSVVLDADTMDRGSLRRVLTQCAQMTIEARCRPTMIIGNVQVTSSGEPRLTNANILWN